MTMNKKQRVLVVAAHPDDEVLGCGGTLAWHVTKGDSVSVIFLSDGELSRLDSSQQSVQSRTLAAQKAAGEIGDISTYFFDFPDNQLDTIPLLTIVQMIEEIGSSVKPSIVYTHHFGDLNIDHRIACQATLTAFRPIAGTSCHTILTFETPSSTEWSIKKSDTFIPNYFVDIQPFLDIKFNALECYSSEMYPPPHPRSVSSIRALALLRGSQVGLQAAEAFCTIRQIAR
jgi:N-acetylglucosamine malate deacetylase 1